MARPVHGTRRDDDAVHPLRLSLSDGSVVAVDELAGRGSGAAAALVRGATLVFRPAAAPYVPDAAAVRRRARLQLKSDERAYQAMVGGSGRRAGGSLPAPTMASYTNQMAIGVNVIVAALSAFAVAYIVTGKWLDKRQRMVAGLGAAICMLVVEVVLVLTRSATMDRAAAQTLERRARADGEAASARAEGQQAGQGKRPEAVPVLEIPAPAASKSAARRRRKAAKQAAKKASGA